MNTLWRVLAALLAVISLFDSTVARGGERRSNYDIRELRARVRPTAEQEKGIAELKRETPGVEVALDARVGTPRGISTVRGFLTGTDPQFAVALNNPAGAPPLDYHGPVKRYLQTHAAVFGHGAEVLTRSRIKRDFVTEHNGMRTVVWEQELDDIPVFDGVLIGHITRRGELVNLSSLMIPSADQAADRGNPNRRAVEENPAISATQAVVLAAANTGTVFTEQGLERDPVKMEINEEEARRARAQQRQSFRSAAFRAPVDAKLVWFPMDRATLRLAWEVVFINKSDPEAYRVVVDAQSGEILARMSLVENATAATYRVWTSDSPSPLSPGYSIPSTNQPPLVPRALTNIVALSTNASPSGWIPDGTSTTIGNNVDARINWYYIPSPMAYATNGFLRPTNNSRTFDFAWDASGDPTSFWEMSTVQLFYWCNWMHDRLYGLGFTEAAGNFQNDNFGRGGVGGDAVVAESQWGWFSGVANNAFFATPPGDGSSTFNPWLAPSLFSWPYPPRDSSLDAEVILHEYTHGLSNRRVGGGIGITTTAARGLGEGWSDFYALALLSEPGDAPDGNYAMGAYSSYLYLGLLDFNFYNYFFGIRRYPYSTVLTNNPLTLKDIDPTRCDLHTNVLINPIFWNDPGFAMEVHNLGEVWCVTLWEARANLIAKHGFSTGNELILRLVTDAMNLTPPNPTFIEARDAVIQADRVDTGGANGEELWRAFAKRGMGSSARTPDDLLTLDTVEAFDLPDEYVLARRILAAGADSTAEVNTNGTVSTWGNNSVGQLGAGLATGNRTTPGPVTNLAEVIAIAGGARYYLALKSDGTVWSWGDNSSGQLGDGTTTTRYSPVRVQGISNVVRVAAGEAFSLAMKADGTVWSWGANASGQLGDGTTSSRTLPLQISNLTEVADIVCGGSHSVALRSDGLLWVWGLNADGQLGDGTTSNRISPVLISAGGPVMSIGAGQSHTLVARNDGTVWAWGLNASGQLGDGTTASHSSPMQVTSLTNVVSVDGGNNHSVALTLGGVVWIWGDNQFGQLGNGTNVATYVPVLLASSGFVLALQSGASHTIALLRDGSTISWGNNSSGQLGDGTTTDRWSPVATLMGQNAANDIVTFESSRMAAGSEFSVVVSWEGTVWTWGRNDVGQLGDGTAIPKIVPRRINGLDSVLEVRAGAAHVLALRNDGTVWAWGANEQGQLGDGTSVSRSSPIRVPGLNGVRSVSTRDRHSVALKSDGTVWAWGANNNGQLGDGSHNKRTKPVQVTGLSNIVAIAAGSSHTLALDSKGAVWAWGGNNNGQLGDGTTKVRLTPVRVSNLTNVSAIAAGFDHSMALRSNSTVMAWGENNHGQIGDNTTLDRRQPVQVFALSNVVTISAGAYYSLARDAFGRVWSWGDNGFGQLGMGTTTDSYVPVQVPSIQHASCAAGGLSHSLFLLADGTLLESGRNQYGQLGIGTLRDQWSPVSVQRPANVAGGGSHTVAVKSDGTVWSMGANASGQLGDGTTNDHSGPVLVNGLSGIISVRAGGSHTLAVDEDGTVWAWGSNSSGELGDGSTTDRLTPVHVSGLVGIVAVAAGENHSVALKYDGTVWGWGANSNGQLGDGTTTTRLTPVPVTNLTTIVEVAAGSAHTYALKNDGAVWAWGNNASGQLGDGTTTSRTAPVQVSTVARVLTIASGNNFGLAAVTNGPVYAWGDNSYGQLGDNSTNNAATAVQVSGLSNVITVAAGLGHSAALTSDRAAHAWGQNPFGQLGDATTTASFVPVLVTNGGMGLALAAGQNHTILTKLDGHVWTFGRNDLGQLGINNTNDRAIPMIVNGAMAGAEINFTGAALRSDGTVWSWGYGLGGALGDATSASRPTAGPVSNLSDVGQLAAGATFSSGHAGYFLVLKTDGTVWAWGDDEFGQIGIGPVLSLPGYPVQVPGLSNITLVAANGAMSFALQNDQTVWAWGYNDAGNLGTGVQDISLFPVHLDVSNVVTISAGFLFSAILKDDGTVWTAGLNSYFELGHTNTDDGFRSLIHRQVPGLSNVVAIDCGAFHTLALKDDGTLWSWGFSGFLGTGSTSNSLDPVQISSLSNIVAFRANAANSQAMDISNAVWSWGFNVGNGSSGYQLTPVQLAIPGKVKAFGSGVQDTASFLKEDGSIWSFGGNDFDQIGDGTTATRLTPVLSGIGLYFNIFR